ncbi:hypothetical protein SDRG_13847 [Saprolegnia diclina VS20]|uniref:SUI1 domain-containing protein n=1 Tax=Saprolegnia diclina (strain VS20) TaxID=1156394 RepID=T0PSQ0_SAPDV|nr:hypothetical protein SDRG_13847 [Saprolegnia diclina VS20]EQC28519.1 hypothetical protein SDRG_13847 [Saprolegnia diclina VS20]|eukprot:XP_008618167.1 hypothetical protein SDRG_13847 [Saprolegnia diclina VS20]
MSGTRQRLERFYAKYNPDKISEIEAALERYKGREASLFEALVRKYGPEPAANEEITFVDAMTLRLQAFYEKYNPEKIGEVPTVLAKYAGKERQLFEALVRKYGPEPGDEQEEYDDDDEDDEDDDEEDVTTPEGSPLSKVIVYCPIDNLPPDYCEYGPMFNECKPWLVEHCPNLFIQKYSRTISELVEVEAQIAAGVEGITLEAEGSKSVKKKKQKAAEEGKRGGKVFVERFQRQKKKFVTVIAGLDEYDLNLKDISKRMGKKFACSATVVKLDSGKSQVQLQGDVQHDLPIWLVEEFSIPEEAIFFLEKGKIDPAF